MKLFGKLAIVTGGYLVAVAIAVTAAVFLFVTLSALLDQARPGSVDRWWNDLILFLIFGGAYTLMFAWPGFVVAIMIARASLWTHWRNYAFAGAANAILSHVLLAMFFGSALFEEPLLVLCSVGGGFVGGAAYWWAAGRFLTRQRTNKATSPALSGS